MMFQIKKTSKAKSEIAWLVARWVPPARTPYERRMGVSGTELPVSHDPAWLFLTLRCVARSRE
ncbi:hypothetical protein, partial [Streptomyces sp. ADI97-07]|uniref:hypothetical protein n=1 Tax=Streptomyces sp. ADI97-07 TaxID=1522762 RepID=UPI0019D0A096